MISESKKFSDRDCSWTATAPANIALLKYWGKRDPVLQWPANDSLSMTLSSATSTTTAWVHDAAEDQFSFADRTISSADGPHKVFRHIDMIRSELGLKDRLHIKSQNSFPQGCGIASSASGFAALTLAVAAALSKESNFSHLAGLGVSRDRLAHWARLGSGSAGRSMFGGFVEWVAGPSPHEQNIRQLYSPDHWKLTNIILVLSDKEKSVSSTEAHKGAWGSPLFSVRLAGVNHRLGKIKDAIRLKDILQLGDLIETEALEMHAVAMTGTPTVNYLLPETAQVLGWIREERQRGGLAGWFTMDAGPNIHLICESRSAADIVKKIQKTWPHFTILMDEVGSGPYCSKNEVKNDR